jgi:hypothetical protein
VNTPFRDSASEAALLQCGYRLGYYSRKDIERWAEQQIEHTDEPSLDMIELAILRGKHDWDVVSLLSRLSSEIGPRARAELAIGVIGRLYRGGKASLESSVRVLFSLLHTNDYTFSRQEEGEIYCLDDGHDLAVIGTYGSIEDVKTLLVEFTEPYVTAVGEMESRLSKLENV